MQKILYIADPEIQAIPIVECHEILIDLKDQTELQFGPPPECELTADCYTKMRKTVFNKLCQAQRTLPQGWYFRIYEGFRSLAVQKMLFDNEYQRVITRHPNFTLEQCFHETTRLVSPVVNFDGTVNIPPHNTGAAIDIEIVMQDGELLDMGMEAKDWSWVEPELCVTASSLVPRQISFSRCSPV